MPDSSAPPAIDRPPARDGVQIDPNKPTDLKTVFLGGLLLLAALTVCYNAAEIILPIILAFVLNLVFQPVSRGLGNLHIPRILAALIIVVAFVAAIALLGYVIITAITAWIPQVPQMLPKIQERLSFISRPMASLQRVFEHIQNLTPGGGGGGGAAKQVAVQSTPISERMLTGVREFGGGALEMVLVLFFLLIAGDRFLRRLVEILPRFQDKRQAVDISQQIEHDISVYLATITIMNTLVGIATGLMAWLVGLGDPLLWGTIAFLLNYVPVLGPTAGVFMFLVVGLVTMDTLWLALLPPALYLLIHVCEGETITPLILAGRFTLNPVLVMVSLIFWYWMWGVAGAILSTPLLAIAKIICDRIEKLRPVGHFIEG
jgi:predicted PurR-regulated permease PerM